jgi:hypothetical protein
VFNFKDKYQFGFLNILKFWGLFMHIKLNELKKEDIHSSELSITSQIDELIDQKTKELINSNKYNLPSIPYIELVFFFDKSGSVEGTELTMVNYLQKLINKYKNINSNILFTFVVFSDSDEVLYYRCPLENVSKLNYNANGGTSLYDSLFKNISTLIQNQIDTNDRPSKTIVTIMTDGEDTTSKMFIEKDVQNIISYTKSLGWEYILLAKNKFYAIDSLGIDSSHIGIYNRSNSICKCFVSIENAIDSYISLGIIKNNWKESLDNKVLKLTKKDD